MPRKGGGGRGRRPTPIAIGAGISGLATSVQTGRAKPQCLLSPDVVAAKERPVLVVGAGIAGLAASLALADIGIPSAIIDQRSIDGLYDGAGINLQRGAIAALSSLGVPAGALLAAGTAIETQMYCLPDGRRVCSLDKQGDSKDGFPGQIAIHRGDLLRLMMLVALSKSEITVVTNHRVSDIEECSSEKGGITVKAERVPSRAMEKAGTIDFSIWSTAGLVPEEEEEEPNEFEINPQKGNDATELDISLAAAAPPTQKREMPKPKRQQPRRILSEASSTGSGSALHRHLSVGDVGLRSSNERSLEGDGGMLLLKSKSFRREYKSVAGTFSTAIMNELVASGKFEDSIGLPGAENMAQTRTIDFVGSMLLGADGIDSQIRKKCITCPTDGDPCQYYGITHYRGVSNDFPSFLGGKTMVAACGKGVKAVVYPIGTPRRGRQKVNWIIAVEEKTAEEASPRNHVLNILSEHGFDLGFLDLKALVSSAPNIQAWPMVDLSPLRTWTSDRIGLVGDAAHAMLPVGSGGAMAAIYDALALRKAFEISGPVPACNVLRLYQNLRKESATMHQTKCRKQPAENIVQEAMDTVPEGLEVPVEYGDRVRRAMKVLHGPPKAGQSKELKAVEDRVLIIGGGPSGLAACKEFAEKGLDPIAFESGPCIGGVFRDAYKKLELTTSSVFTEFSDYPAKDEVPTMWTAAEYISYLHHYAVDNDVFKRIEFNSTVVGVRRIEGGNVSGDGRLWEVTVFDSSTNTKRVVRSGHLVVSVGSNASPNIPVFPGQETFEGQVIHTSRVNGFEMFKGKRVLCLGIGESGSDLPYHIAKEEGTTLTVAVRGLGWMVPRRRPLNTGSPTDLNTNRLLWGLPRIFNRVLSFLLAYFDSRVDGDPVIRRMGMMNLAHPAGVYNTYGTKSINYLVAIEHMGARFVGATIQNMGPGHTVRFADGSNGEYDIVLLNTGYTKSSFEGFCHPTSMKESHDSVLYNVLKEASYVRNLFKRVVHPAMKHLYFIGFARPGFASIPAIAETHARYAASLAAGTLQLVSEEDMLSSISADKFRDERQFSGPAMRIGALADYLPHVCEIASLLGSSPPYLKMLLTDPTLFFKIMLGPAAVVQFRLRGPDAKPFLALKTIHSYPPIPMRRLTYIAFGLYSTSLLLLVLSLLLPLPSQARKSLQPVGFPPLRNKLLLLLRSLLFWLHTLALAHVCSNVTNYSKVAPVIIAVIGSFELYGHMERRKRKGVLRELLTTSAEVDGKIEYGSPGKKAESSCSTTCNANTRAGPNLGPIAIAMAVLAFFLAKAQSAFEFRHPTDMKMRQLLKQQRSHKSATPLVSTKAGGLLLDELTKVHNFTPLERVVLTANGNVQGFFSAFYLQHVDVSIERFDMAISDEKQPVAEDSASPLAVYDREVQLKILGQTFCRAESIVRVYDPKIFELLSSKQVGIGQLLKVMKLYPEFTLHDAGRNDDGSIWRFYSLDCEGLIEFDIFEAFTGNAFDLQDLFAIP